MAIETRQIRRHRGHRIAVIQIAGTWNAIVYAPDGAIVTADPEGASTQEATIKAMHAIDGELARRSRGDEG